MTVRLKSMEGSDKNLYPPGTFRSDMTDSGFLLSQACCLHPALGRDVLTYTARCLNMDVSLSKGLCAIHCFRSHTIIPKILCILRHFHVYELLYFKTKHEQKKDELVSANACL